MANGNTLCHQSLALLWIGKIIRLQADTLPMGWKAHKREVKIVPDAEKYACDLTKEFSTLEKYDCDLTK